METIRKLKKKINLNLTENQIHKLKVRVQGPRSCNPDMRKLRLIKSILETSSLHVMIDLKAKIYLPNKIVMPDRLKEKVTPDRLKEKATPVRLKEKVTPRLKEKATPRLKENLTLKKVNKPEKNPKVKASKDNNLKTSQQTKAKIHRQLLHLNNAQLTQGAQIFLNTLKRRMDRKHASCLIAIMLVMATLNLALTVTIPMEGGLIHVMSSS